MPYREPTELELLSQVPIPWSSRGLGLDLTPGCFVCGSTLRCEGANEYMNNIAAHIAVHNQANILACFPRGARMGYYHGDEMSPQVKVGACDKHVPVLEELGHQWFISPYRVAQLITGVLRHEELLAEVAARG